MKKLLPIILLLSAGHAFADSLAEKKEVWDLVKKYSETTSCDTTFEDGRGSAAKDVFLADQDTELGSATYYVFWGGDFGCAGGTGTWAYSISEVVRDTGNRPFTVRNDDALGSDFTKNVNGRFIDSVKQVSGTEFIVVSADFADDDSNNFPSRSYQYTIKREDQWKPWIVTDSKYLGKRE